MEIVVQNWKMRVVWTIVVCLICGLVGAMPVRASGEIDDNCEEIRSLQAGEEALYGNNGEIVSVSDSDSSEKIDWSDAMKIVTLSGNDQYIPYVHSSKDFERGDIINFGHYTIPVVLSENPAEEALQDNPVGFYQYEDGIWYRVSKSGVKPTIPVRWIVLEDEGDTLLVMQEYIFMGTAWDSATDGTNLTWENSQIRFNINSESYLSSFFTPEEIQDIQVSVVSNTAPGDSEMEISSTEDRLFLPSIEEINLYFSTDEDRKAHYYDDGPGSPYITTPMTGFGEAGAYDRTEYTCAYWLRSPDTINYGFSKPGMVNCYGSVGTYGRVYNTWSLGVRPMMRIAKDSVNYYRAPENVQISYLNDIMEIYGSSAISVVPELTGDNLTEQFQPFIMYSDGSGRISDSGIFKAGYSRIYENVHAILYGVLPTALQANVEMRIKPAIETIKVETCNGGLKITSTGRLQGDGTEIQRRTLPDGQWETIYATGSIGEENLFSYTIDADGNYTYEYKDITAEEDKEYEYRTRGLFYIGSGKYSATLEEMESEWSNLESVKLPSANLDIITTTDDLNMEDVIRVKYVPYSYTVKTNNADIDNTVTFSVVEGRLAEGLQMYPETGEIYGVPMEAGEFPIRVMASYSNPTYGPSYAELTLTVLENTDENVSVATDSGYEITEPVLNFDRDTIPVGSTQTLVSQGEYSRFRDVYIDGQKLTEGQDYISASGSTRITIYNQTLGTAGTGTHTLGVEFRTEDGVLRRAAQNYTVSSAFGDGITLPDNGGESNDIPPADSGDGNETDIPAGDSGSDNTANNSGQNGGAVQAIAEETEEFIIYTVVRGDSLWKIAARYYGSGSRWRNIYEDNAAIIRSPGLLYAGQQLRIRIFRTDSTETPTTAAINTAGIGESSYRVQKGDSLWAIAHKVYGKGNQWNRIYEVNKDVIADPEKIRVGQQLTIPQN